MKIAGTPRLEPAQQVAKYHRPVTILQQPQAISSDLATRGQPSLAPPIMRPWQCFR
jgi:hypothetical protein